METTADVRAHYARTDLLDAIQGGLAALGKSPDAVTLDDLAAVDEFHIGGRQASEELFERLDLGPAMSVLDVGCGIGGAARFVASRYGCRVTGVDLTAEFIETGNALCRWLHLDNRVTLQCENALSLPFADEAFDRAYMMHVGMNLRDKSALFSEVARLLRRDSSFGVYDIMRSGAGELAYPQPWATTPETSWVATPDDYRAALEDAGFEVIRDQSRRELALAFFERMLARAKAAGGPPPLGLHLIMGSSAPQKVRNMVDNVSAGVLTPVEIIAKKR